MAAFGFSTSAFSIGSVVCLLYYSEAVMSSMLLVQPFVGQLFGYVAKIDRFPGWMTWLGSCVVVLGILALNKADGLRSKESMVKEQKVTLEPTKTKTLSNGIDLEVEMEIQHNVQSSSE